MLLQETQRGAGPKTPLKIDVSPLKNGVYFISFDDSKKLQKFIIQR